MERDNELVKMGRLLDDTAYERDEKHIDVLGYANIDSIHGNTIREVKKSKSLEEASVWQMKYYLYLLRKYGVEKIQGEICYPLLKQTVCVTLEQEDICEIEKISDEIYRMNQSAIPTADVKKSVCRKCAYFDLCNI